MGCSQICEESCKKANKKYPGLTPGAAFDFTLADHRVYSGGALSVLPLGLVGGDTSICPVLQVHCLSFLKGRACHMPCTPLMYPTISQAVEKAQYRLRSTVPKGIPSIPYYHNFLSFELLILIHLLLR